jgi:hypothetical protein
MWLFIKFLLCSPLCIQLKRTLSPNKVWVRISLMARCTQCNLNMWWLAAGWWFSLGTLVSYINKIDHHDITENPTTIRPRSRLPPIHWWLTLIPSFFDENVIEWVAAYYINPEWNKHRQKLDIWKIDHHDITEMVLKVALNTITIGQQLSP